MRIPIRAQDYASREINKVRGTFGTLRSEMKGGLMAGIGLGAGVTAFAALGGAIRSVTGFLGDSIKAAAEEEVSITRLGAALEANVPNWKSSTGAIEDAIKAGEDLAFSDDQIRDSLTRLTPVTHDVEEALRLQATAMDLARWRGIDLTSASDILAKVQGGNVGILARYGIVVEKGSTATEALAQIQRAAAGQAEAYGDTTAGAAESMQIAMENLQEEIGTALMPVVKQFFTFVRDDGIPILRNTIGLLGHFFGEIGEGIDTLNDLAAPMQDRLRDLPQVAEALAEIGVTSEEMAEVAGTSAEGLTDALEAVRDMAVHTGGDIEQAWDLVTRGVDTTEARLNDFQLYLEADPLRGPAATAAEALAEELQAGEDAAVAIMRSTPNDLANALYDGLGDYQAALDEIVSMTQNSVSDARQLAEIEAVLASQGIRDGLMSESSETRLRTMAFVEDLVSQYEFLAPGALAAGELVNPALAEGINSNIDWAVGAAKGVATRTGQHLDISATARVWGATLAAEYAQGIRDAGWQIEAAARGAAAQVADNIGIESEPKSPGSPLRGITKWGGNIVKTVREGILAQTGSLADAARHMAGAISLGNVSVPSLALASAGGASQGAAGYAGGGSSGNTYITFQTLAPLTPLQESEIRQRLKPILDRRD